MCLPYMGEGGAISLCVNACEEERERTIFITSIKEQLTFSNVGGQKYTPSSTSQGHIEDTTIALSQFVIPVKLK